MVWCGWVMIEGVEELCLWGGKERGERVVGLGEGEV